MIRVYTKVVSYRMGIKILLLIKAAKMECSQSYRSILPTQDSNKR